MPIVSEKIQQAAAEKLAEALDRWTVLNLQ